jgi:hypothetical protein
VLKAVNKVAHFDNINKKYGALSVASNIGTNLKQIGNLLITECTKTNDIKKQSSTENFLKLVQEDYGISINKTVEENIMQYKRQKKVTLPSMEDIKKLHSYLKKRKKIIIYITSEEIYIQNMVGACKSYTYVHTSF